MHSVKPISWKDLKHFLWMWAKRTLGHSTPHIIVGAEAVLGGLCAQVHHLMEAQLTTIDGGGLGLQSNDQLFWVFTWHQSRLQRGRGNKTWFIMIGKQKTKQNVCLLQRPAECVYGRSVVKVKNNNNNNKKEQVWMCECVITTKYNMAYHLHFQHSKEWERWQRSLNAT